MCIYSYKYTEVCYSFVKLFVWRAAYFMGSLNICGGIVISYYVPPPSFNSEFVSGIACLLWLCYSMDYLYFT